MRDANRYGIIDVAPSPNRQPDEYVTLKVGRLRHLERLRLAETIGPGQWIIAEEAEATLRELGERGDIIKRMHRALTERGIDRGLTDYVIAGEAEAEPIIGRLVERGLDDELRGTAYAVIDGIDGRTHHIRFHDLDAAGDSAPGSIVELRRYEDSGGRTRAALAVRADLSIEAQTTATGSTWIDRQLVSRDPLDTGGGFGLEVKQAMEVRADHLVAEGLARREGQRIVFARNLLATLRERELDALGQKLAAETGATFQKAAARRICRRHLPAAFRARLRPLRHDRRRARLQAGALDAIRREAHRSAHLRRRPRQWRRGLVLRTQAGARPMSDSRVY